MDRELISEHAEGIIATTGCPSGAVQTRLRLNQYDEAREVAAAYQEIFGRENYFLELMDHGLAIEREVRDGLLRLAKDLDIPLLATNDAHYVTRTRPTRTTTCCASASARTRTTRTGSVSTGTGYYLKTAAEMRELFSELPEACDNTLLIAERVEPYDEVFDNVDEMPQFPDVPEGETQESWLRKECLQGPRHALRRPGPGAGAGAVRDRDERHRPDGVLLVLPRRRGHLPVRPRQRHRRSARAVARPPVRSSRTPPASPSCARWSTACCSSGS